MTTTTMVRKGLPASVRSLERGQFTARITTDVLDRDREVLMPAGCRTKDYEANPVVLWNHDASVPIGRCVALRRDNDGVTATAQLAQRPPDYQGDFLPEFLGALVSQGIVTGVSVGFVSRERRLPTKADRDRWGDELRQVHSKWDLLEFSLVALPSNPTALVTAVGKGLVTRAQCKRWLSVEIPEQKPEPRRIVVHVNRGVAIRDEIRSTLREELAVRRGRIWA